MKPTAFLRSFLLFSSSVLFTISYSHGQTILADTYLASLDVSSDTTLYASLNFPSYLVGPLTGSSTLTLTGYFGSQLSLVNNGASNTFNGNIIVDSGTLRVGGDPFGANGGFTAPSMTSSNTITINRAGTLNIDDNFTTTLAGYTANRFGTASRPAVNLAGGTISLNGVNNVSSSVQTFGALTLSSGPSTINVTRNFAGTPTLTFASLTKNSGAYVNFTGTLLGTGANDARILFTTGPTLTGGAGASGTKTMSILAGARSGNDFVWYDSTNGIRALVAAEYQDFASNDINTAGSTENVRITGATPTTVVALGGDRVINSLIMTGAGNLEVMTNKLTLTSGQFMSTANNTRNITSGVITAGSGSAIDLNMTILSNTTTVGTSANINDNGSGVVTLVKAGTGTLALANNTTNNGYSGGTYVIEGTLTTGTTASRVYLGSGAVTVNNAVLTLGSYGATSNATGDDYTAINGAQINIASGAAGAYTSGDKFNIAAGSVIAGGSASGQGLASLTRGTNITLASGAIIGQAALTAALNTTTGTIQNLGTSANYFYGLNATQNSATGSINIGSGTAFRGISTDRTARAWQQGIINIASGTTSVDFQGLAVPSVAPVALTLGNGTGANGAPVINFAGSGTVDIKAIGSLTLNDDTAIYGSTGANVRFVATAGSTITVNTATGMGSGTGIASALVQNGGTLASGAISNALNGAVTVESGGRYLANQSVGLTGTGALTFNAGSILEISTNATGFSGTQASGASIAAGTIVRLNANGFGAAGTTLDSVLGSGANAPIFIITGNNRSAAEPTNPDTAILTLNKDINGVGGILTNFEFSNRGLGFTANGFVALGARGGTIAATTGNIMGISEDIRGVGSLTIGTTDIIDGLTKLGTVELNAINTYTGGTIVNAGTLKTLNTSALGSTSGQLTVNTGGTLEMNNNSLTVGNLTGTGGEIRGGVSGTRTLTIGQGDFGGGNYQGSIQNGTGGTTALTKTGTGTITLSGSNSYTGATNVNDGKLIVNGNISTSTLTTVQTGATLGGSGTVGKTIVNGTLAVGNSPGQMDFTDTLGLNGVTIMEIDGLSGAGVTGGHDFVNLTGLGAAGVLTYGGTMTLDMGVLFVGGTYSWNLFDMASETGTFTGITLADQYSGSLLDADLNGVWDLTSGDNTWQFTESTGVLGLTVAAVPEPRAALLGGLGLLMLFRRRRN